MRTFAAVLLASVLFGGCAAAGPASVPPAGAVSAEYFPVPGRPELPFSDAVRVGPWLFVSGQIGMDSTGRRLVAGGIVPETAAALASLRTTLERYGSSLDQVVKCTALLADMAEWDTMNRVYATFFPNHRPARTALGVNGLVFGARIEFDCLATVAAP
jgi:2-iminobutanoate/2-iminopropanoate deaminase